jgi:hypothetical protein
LTYTNCAIENAIGISIENSIDILVIRLQPQGIHSIGKSIDKSIVISIDLIAKEH